MKKVIILFIICLLISSQSASACRYYETGNWPSSRNLRVHVYRCVIDNHWENSVPPAVWSWNYKSNQVFFASVHGGGEYKNRCTTCNIHVTAVLMELSPWVVAQAGNYKGRRINWSATWDYSLIQINTIDYNIFSFCNLSLFNDKRWFVMK